MSLTAISGLLIVVFLVINDGKQKKYEISTNYSRQKILEVLSAKATMKVYLALARIIRISFKKLPENNLLIEINDCPFEITRSIYRLFEEAQNKGDEFLTIR